VEHTSDIQSRHSAVSSSSCMLHR